MPKLAKTYRITAEMLKAGANALEQCRALGGHTPQTVCQAVFTAMLNAADSTPGANLRKSFLWSPHDRVTETHGGRVIRGVMSSRPPLAQPLAAYASLTLHGYAWQGFHFRYRKHCFKSETSDTDWRWMFESDWNDPGFESRLESDAFHVDPVFCWQELKAKRITRS